MSRKGQADQGGEAALETVAGDDRYLIQAQGYEAGSVRRSWFKYRLRDGEGGATQEIVQKSGALVVTLRRSAPR